MTQHPEAQHTAMLCEHHVITTRFGADVPAKEIGRQYQETLDAQRAIADRWAAAHGMEIGVVSAHDPQDDGSVLITTAWMVIVGKAEVDADQDPPGALDRWKWSARVGFWRNLTAGLGREGRRLAVREDGMASVTPLRRGFGLRAADTDLLRPPTPQMPHPEGGEVTGPAFSLDSVPAVLSEGVTSTVPNEWAEQEQMNQSGYLPGTGPVEHRPAWLRNDSLAGDVGGDWSDT